MNDKIKEIWWYPTGEDSKASEYDELKDKINEIIRVVNRIVHGSGEDPA